MSSTNSRSRWWREPLVHFLVIGGLLFLAFDRWGVGSAGASRIVITPGQIDALVANFERTWQRLPTEEEVRNLVQDQIREEIATREAMSLGLDKDDTVIRRRLRQKFEFAAEDTIDATPPTEADLQRWLDANPDAFRQDPEVAFSHVYLSPDAHRDTLARDADALLAQLKASGATTAPASMGDTLMLPADVPRSALTEVARQFGDAFATELAKAPTGAWSGPIRSGYGLHLVFVSERTPGRVPPLAEILPVVSREFTSDRRRRQLDALYVRLLGNYTVVVEPRAPAAPGAPAPASAPAPAPAEGPR